MELNELRLDEHFSGVQLVLNNNILCDDFNSNLKHLYPFPSCSESFMIGPYSYLGEHIFLKGICIHVRTTSLLMGSYNISVLWLEHGCVEKGHIVIIILIV